MAALVVALFHQSGASGDIVEAQPPISDDSAEVRSQLPLFHRVNDLYMRGATPGTNGVDALIRLGVRTIVDLRSYYDHSDEVGLEAESRDLAYYWVPMSVWNPPADTQTEEFLSVVTNRANGPCFVFCADGLNRTGEMTAIYRIVHDGWHPDRALKEMDGLGFSPYYWSLRNYVWMYARVRKPESVH